MKYKIINKILLCIMLFNISAVLLVAADTTVTLPVRNYSFENGLDFFEVISLAGTAPSFDTDQKSDGLQSLKMEDGSSSSGFNVESLKILAYPGLTHTFMVDVRNMRTGTSYPYLYINFYDVSGVRLETRPSATVSPVATFQPVTISGIAPEGAKYVSLSLTTTGAYTGTVNFDNIRLSVESTYTGGLADDTQAVNADFNELQLGFLGNDSEESVKNSVELDIIGENGSVIFWQSDNLSVMDDAGNVNGEISVASAVTLSATLTRGSVKKTKEFHLNVVPNLNPGINLFNAGFELGFEGYDVKKVGNPDVQEFSDEVFSGEKSLSLSAEAGENIIVSGHRSEIIPNEGYSAYVKVFKIKGEVKLSLNFLDGDENIIDTHTRVFNGNKERWESLGVSADSPSKAVYADVCVEISEKSSFILDNLILTARWTDLGMPIALDYIQSAVYSKDKNGRDIIYTVITDESGDDKAIFTGVDVARKDIVEEIEIPNAQGSFSMLADKNKDIFIGTYVDGRLYKYVSETGELKDLGQAVPGETHIFRMTLTEDGIIYGGTYPGCYVFSYDTNFEGGGFTIHSPNGVGERFDLTGTYARSTAYDDENDILYVGTGTNAKLYRYDVGTGVATSVLPAQYQEQSYIDYMTFENGKLFCYMYPDGDLLVMSFDGAGNPTLDNVLKGSVKVTPAINGKSYYIGTSKAVMTYDYMSNTTDTIVDGEGQPGNLPIVPCVMEVVELSDQEQYPGFTMICLANGIQRDMRLATYNLTNFNTELLGLDLPTTPYSARSITAGPNGKIYTSNHLGGGTGVYDPIDNSKNMFYGLSQAESGIAINDKVYFGCYTNAKVYEYSPDIPWDMNASNPKRIFQLGASHEQDRPFGIATGDDYLFVGTSPVYGKLGGAIAIYNVKTKGAPYVLRNIVEDQAVVSLAYKDGILYGGTSKWGGIGAEPTANTPKFFAFDVEKKEKIFEMTIQENKHLISALEIGTDGKVWGICDGYMFCYNPDSGLIEYNENVFPELVYNTVTKSSTKHSGAQLVSSDDGYLYGNTGGKFFRLNPHTRQVEIIRNASSIFIAKDINSNIYFSDYKNMWKYSGFDSDDVIRMVTVSVSKTGEGSLSCSEVNSVISGECFSLTISPDEGQKIKSVLLDGVPIIVNEPGEIPYVTPPLTKDTYIEVIFDRNDSPPNVVTSQTVYTDIPISEFAEINQGDSFAAVFAAVSDNALGYTLKSYGMLFSETVLSPELRHFDCEQITAVGKNNAGQYGVIFYGKELSAGGQYFIRPYAVYRKSEKTDIVVYGDVNIWTPDSE